MKDITIKASVLKRELFILFICFAISNAINLYAIISRDTRWIELITMLPVVLILTFFFYGWVWVYRGIVRIFSRKKVSDV